MEPENKILSQFVRLSEKRSSSHWLSDLISSHPKFFTAGEYLQFPEKKEYKYDKEVSQSVLNGDFSAILKHKHWENFAQLRPRHFGIILHRSDFTDEIDQFIRENPSIKYIVLRRCDHLERFASLKVARKLSNFGSKNALDQERIPSLHIKYGPP